MRCGVGQTVRRRRRRTELHRDSVVVVAVAAAAVHVGVAEPIWEVAVSLVQLLSDIEKKS